MRSLVLSLVILLVTVTLALRSAAFTVSVADDLIEGVDALGDLPTEADISALTAIWEGARERIARTSPLDRVEEIDAALDELSVLIDTKEHLFFETAKRRLRRAARGLSENELIPLGAIP